jgi:hypothetical protein
MADGRTTGARDWNTKLASATENGNNDLILALAAWDAHGITGGSS